MKQDSGSPEEAAKLFINEQAPSIEEALQGARDIINVEIQKIEAGRGRIGLGEIN